MADDELRLEVWSLPHVGTFAKRLDLSKFVESYTFNDRFNDLCDGVFVIPDDAVTGDGTLVKDKLLKIDEANHANDVGSVIRLLRGGVPIHHQIVTRLEDTWSDGDPTTKGATEGLEWLLDRALVSHFDHPDEPTFDPDWTYGADTIVPNSGFEESAQSSEKQSFFHTQAAGTYTVTFDGQTTSALNWNDGWFELHQALEALSNVADVVVTGAGTPANPFQVEFLDPSGDVALMTSTATGAVIQVAEQGGILDPGGATKSFHPQTGKEHGVYQTFEVSDDFADTGTYSLKVDCAAVAFATDYGGAQWILNVTGGRTYNAHLRVRPTFAATFRLVVRTMDETLIAVSEVALTANTFQTMTLDPFVVPKHVTQIIYRLGLIDPDDEGAFYIDNVHFAAGVPAAPIGEIFNDTWDAYLAAGGVNWIHRTWTDTLDSGGNAWDQDRKWTVTHDQSFLQLWEYARKWNYEFRIRWDVGDNRFEWDIFNPTEGGQVRTGIAITGKSGVTSSNPIVRRPPDATYMRVEGEIGTWGEFASTTLDDVWGRLEKAQRDRQGVAGADLDELASRLITRGQDKTSSRSVRVSDPAILPWQAYEPGDTVTLNLAPKDTKQALRIAAIVVSKDPGQAAPEYVVQFTSPVLSNDAAIVQGLRTLLREFRKPAPTIPSARVENPPIRFGMASFIAIAAVDSTDQAKAAAHLVCDGADDQVEWNQACTSLKQIGGTIVAAPGNYQIAGAISPFRIQGSLYIQGPGAVLHMAAAGIRFFALANPTGLNQYGSITFESLSFDAENQSAGQGIIFEGLESDANINVLNCTFANFDGRFFYAERGAGNHVRISNCRFRNSTMTGGTLESPSQSAIQINSGSALWYVWITDNSFDTVDASETLGVRSLIDLNTLPAHITGNSFENCAVGDLGLIVPRTNTEVYNNWLEGTFVP